MYLYKVLVVMWCVVASVLGHGRVVAPPSRASAWRFGFNTARDYDDTASNCGGVGRQWSKQNGGRCGVCGDPFADKAPRAHELGGMYGQGIIVKNYTTSFIDITVELTAYHMGFWEFKICDDPERNDQECFDQYPLELENGGTKYYPKKGNGKYTVAYRLPLGLVCEHCVLQWKYTAGNSWGVCANNTVGLGCGNQEQFAACSDISIRKPGFKRFNDNGITDDNEKKSKKPYLKGTDRYFSVGKQRAFKPKIFKLNLN